MKMDILSWTKLNPTVKQVDTKKKFFNKYLYKAVVNAPGCRIINDNKAQDFGINSLLEKRIEILQYQKQTTYSRYWVSRAEYLITHAQVDQLSYWLDIKTNLKDSIKIRIEEPYLTVYSNDPDQLYNIVKENYPERLQEIHAPANSASIDILNRGEIVVKKEPEFQYKIMLKENKLRNLSAKRNLLDYLYNLGDDEVCLTKSLIKHLGSNNIWFPGGYFYAKDEKIVTFINLIVPECIAGIYKLSNPDL
jgi:hypothetical protein